MAIGAIIGLQSNNHNDDDLELTLSKNFININVGESTTITINTPSDGKIYAMSSDPNIVTVSINNNIITINAIEYGSVIIYIGQDTGTGTYANIMPKIIQLFVLIQLVNEPTLNNNNWETISEVSQMGAGNQYWSIGDMKSIALNGTIGTLSLNNFKTNVFILHFNYSMNGVADNNIIWGGFKDSSGIDIALVDSLYKSEEQSQNGTMYFNMNHWGTVMPDEKYGGTYEFTSNYGGWKGCDFRYDILGATSTQPSGYGAANDNTARTGYDATSATLANPKANTLLAALPSNFRNNLRLWSRWIDAVGNYSNVDANIKETIDAVTLLAEFEVYGTRCYANEYERNHQFQMEYYRLGNSKEKYDHDDFSRNAPWWLASPHYDTNHHFCGSCGEGFYGPEFYANLSWGIAPAFKT